MIRRGVQLLLAILLVLVAIFNVRLYEGSDSGDAVLQLRFLRNALDRGAGDDMQELFPEGFFFMHALYGSAWIEVGRAEPAGSVLRSEAVVEAKWALDQLESPTRRAQFPANLDPPHGVFHAGWTNWLRGGWLALHAEDAHPVEEWRVFAERSMQLGEAFDKSDTPFLESYAGRAWPVDSAVAMASLRLHDHLAPERFAATRARWRERVQERLDPATGLIPHRVDPKTGLPSEGARGSSQALLLRFFLEIDPDLGRKHYAAFRSRFVQFAWLLPGTREHPIGSDGPGDLDSGTLIAGVSLSASAVTIAAARLVGDDRVSDPYLHLGEAMGMPVSWRGERRYLGGQLPIADAFHVYARTATAWTERPAEVACDPIVPKGWRLGWHVVTLGPIAVLLWLSRKPGKRKNGPRLAGILLDPAEGDQLTVQD
jgi:hypothetical protein